MKSNGCWSEYQRMSVLASTRWHWKPGMWAQHCLRGCHILTYPGPALLICCALFLVLVQAFKVCTLQGDEYCEFAGNRLEFMSGVKALGCATDFLLSQGKNSWWSACKGMSSLLQNSNSPILQMLHASIMTLACHFEVWFWTTAHTTLREILLCAPCYIQVQLCPIVQHFSPNSKSSVLLPDHHFFLFFYVIIVYYSIWY
jgi:hypothetical protein